MRFSFGQWKVERGDAVKGEGITRARAVHALAPMEAAGDLARGIHGIAVCEGHGDLHQVVLAHLFVGLILRQRKARAEQQACAQQQRQH